MFEIERGRDKERKIGYSLHKGTETLVRDRERFEIEGFEIERVNCIFKKDILKTWRRVLTVLTVW